MSAAHSPYPETPSQRDRWILALRGIRNSISPTEAVGWFSEVEPNEEKQPKTITTLFLANRECPYRCVMCDLWKSTLPHSVPPGAIPQQIRQVLEKAPPSTQIKLYNSGSFFDPQAIPRSDYSKIAELVSPFERVIVESHPFFVPKAKLFGDLLSSDLEVAIGLETSRPDALAKLNKRMNLDDFRRSADFLKDQGISLRVFLLLRPPFIPANEASDWLKRSIEFAFQRGAGVVSIIPTRAENGAMEALAAEGLATKPHLGDLEEAVEYGLQLARGRVFADLWNLEQLAICQSCFEPRRERLVKMNLQQISFPRVVCKDCDGTL